ncbi:hypothetical protein Tco_0656429 [Tanacetum coccineum]|uniref:Uncharacterized protein n=1 Tax=Tanacetum coccineum TaxID=301880 RepID=A0ABQ4X9Y7_9ASTR
MMHLLASHLQHLVTTLAPKHLHESPTRDGNSSSRGISFALLTKETRNLSKEKGKNVISSPVISSSTSSSDENEGPYFLEFYDELSDSEDLTKAQQEKRGMFKCLDRYVGTLTNYLEKQK